MMDRCAPERSDLAGRIGTSLLVWGPPLAALLASSWMPERSLVAVWPLALSWMGVACLWNAARCGRVHCYFTGPFFLLLALLSLLHGLGIVSLGPNGWQGIGVALLVGGCLLAWAPELLLGRYRRGRPR